MEDKYNCLHIGCGAMGVGNKNLGSVPFTYDFASAILKNDKTHLVGFVDMNETKTADANKQLVEAGYSAVPSFTYLQEALERLRSTGQRIDIISCAAGPEVNAQVLRLADLGLDIKGIWCEKPLSLSLAKLDEFADIEAESKIKMQVNYLRNYDTHHLAVLDYIRNGGIGTLLTIRLLYKGGVLAVAPHGFALINRLLGKPIAVSGMYSPLLNWRDNADPYDDPNIDGTIQYAYRELYKDTKGNKSYRDRIINVQAMSTGKGDPELENDTYLFEYEFIGSKAHIRILQNGWETTYEKMVLSKTFSSLGLLMPVPSLMPPELQYDKPREFMLEALERLITAIETDTPTNCNMAASRDAEEISHALAISAAAGVMTNLPLQGRERDHKFANARAGTDLLRKEHAASVPKADH